MVSNLTQSVILASRSPRRRELLERCGFTVYTYTSEIPEVLELGESFAEYTLRLAGQKVKAVEALVGDAHPEVRFMIGADTVVVLDDELLEKPRDFDDAVDMLSRLSGRTHEVLTSFGVLDRETGRLHVELCPSKVRFRELSQTLIQSYVATGDPMDKAGAYGIQSMGIGLVERLEGSYAGVMGLPVSNVLGLLESLNAFSGFPSGLKTS